MIQTIQLQTLFQWDQNYFLQSNNHFTQYILTQVHPLNTTYEIIYLLKHTLGGFMSTYPYLLLHGHFPLSKIIMSQHNSNYSTTHIISMGSKLFLSVKYTFHSIYSNTSLSTKHNLWNNLFKHTLGGFMIKIISFSQIYFSLNIFSLPLWPFPTVQTQLTSQHNSNYSPKHTIWVGSKLCPSVPISICTQAYSNTCPSTKYKCHISIL